MSMIHISDYYLIHRKLGLPTLEHSLPVWQDIQTVNHLMSESLLS